MSLASLARLDSPPRPPQRPSPSDRNNPSSERTALKASKEDKYLTSDQVTYALTSRHTRNLKAQYRRPRWLDSGSDQTVSDGLLLVRKKPGLLVRCLLPVSRERSAEVVLLSLSRAPSVLARDHPLDRLSPTLHTLPEHRPIALSWTRYMQWYIHRSILMQAVINLSIAVVVPSTRRVKDDVLPDAPGRRGILVRCEMWGEIMSCRGDLEDGRFCPMEDTS